jgi:predicted phosphodiesterase
METVDEIMAFKPVKGVYGNIDGAQIRRLFPEVLHFEAAGLRVCIVHIGGYPGRYSPLFKAQLAMKPDVMVTGHSHILKVMRDKRNNLMHFNPGAAGNKGFHQVCTALRLRIAEGRLCDLEVWEKKRI